MLDESKSIIGWFGGKNRRLYPKECPACGKQFFLPKHFYETRTHCSRKCRHKVDRRRVQIKCHTCGNIFERRQSALVHSKSGYRFCSRKCKEAAQAIGGLKAIQPAHYKTGKYSYRKRAIKLHGAKCARCGYNENPHMLDVHHIDRNRSNGAPHNLIVLCIWCHVLETRRVTPHAWNGTIVQREDTTIARLE
jgi:hypothetical protein